jgi:aldehyde:ferredoxin oxidoreductase
VAFAVLDNAEGLPTIVEMVNAKYGANLTDEEFAPHGTKFDLSGDELDSLYNF